MLTKPKEFVKEHQKDIVLFVLVFLISMLSFALGFIVAKLPQKEPLKIEHWGGKLAD